MNAGRTLCVFLLAGTLIFAAGCQKKRVWAVPSIRVPTAPPAMAMPPDLEPPDMRPDLKYDLASLMAWPRLEPVRPTPPRQTPRTEPAQEPEPSRATPPQISPRLSPAEVANYQRMTNDAIAAAERNLASADGKNLNAMQRDMVEKIRSFLGQSREAVRVADWPRAHNLAQKAQLLSIELVNSM